MSRPHPYDNGKSPPNSLPKNSAAHPPKMKSMTGSNINHNSIKTMPWSPKMNSQQLIQLLTSIVAENSKLVKEFRSIGYTSLDERMLVITINTQDEKDPQ